MNNCKKFKRNVCLLLCSVLLMTALFSCADAVDTSSLFEKGEEGISPLENLLEESKILNEIYFGEGIPTKENGHKIGVYLEADTLSMAEYGFTDIDSIKKMVDELIEAHGSWLPKFN